VDQAPARELYTATDSTALIDPIRGSYRDGSVRHVSHAAVGGSEFALCGCRPAFGPNGTRHPLRQFRSGIAVLCSVCAERAGRPQGGSVA
jgi:hypothetical protein